MNPKVFPHWQKVCCMPTRRCNIRCRGCNVVNFNSSYEMTTAEWCKAFDTFKHYGVGFVVLFGGEPTLRDDLPEMVKYLNKIKMPHTIITNSIRLLKDKPYYDRLIAAKPCGFSVSLNEISHGKAKYGDELKSQQGYQLIQKVKKDLPACDLVANMAVTTANINGLPKIVEWLSANGIWAIMTFIHLCDPHESTYWWYRGPWTKDSKHLMFTKKDAPKISKVADYFIKNHDRLLLHNSVEYFKQWSTLGISQDWHCSYFTCPNINPDGSIMACVDRPLASPVNILDLPRDEELLQYVFDEAIDSCSGCFWDHEFETNMYAIKGQAEQGKKIFAHKLR